MKTLLACAWLLVIFGSVCAGEPKDEGTALTVYRESEELQQYRRQYGGGQQYDPSTGQYIYPIPGWGVVKVRRKFTLTEGPNVVRFQDVASAIDATSVLVTSLTDPEGTVVQEQNYEYDLVNPTKILQKYVDHPIAVGSEGAEVRGDLLSYDNASLVLKTDDQANPIRILTRNEKIRELRFSALPGGLITRPTLVWHLHAKKAGEQVIQATYHTNQIGWRADYTATVNSNETALDLSSWVTVNNRSGAEYKDARLKFVGGDVQRVIPAAQHYQMEQYGFRGDMDRRQSGRAQFEEKSFFEYHLYTLERPATIANNSEKQIELFLPVSNVPLNKRLVYYGGRGMYNYSQHGGQPNQDRNFGLNTNTKVDVYLEFKNEKKAGLGIPLPAGKVRVYKRDPDDKVMEFIGEDEVDHTSKDELVRLRMGSAFDVAAERRQTNFEAKYDEHWIVESFEIKVRNHKKEDVEVIVQEDLYRWVNWEITQSSVPHEKMSSQRVLFPLKVKSDGEATLTYTVRYTW